MKYLLRFKYDHILHIVYDIHRRTHGPKLMSRDRVWLPLCVAMSQHCEEPECSFQTLEGRTLIDYNVALFNVLIYCRLL